MVKRIKIKICASKFKVSNAFAMKNDKTSNFENFNDVKHFKSQKREGKITLVLKLMRIAVKTFVFFKSDSQLPKSIVLLTSMTALLKNDEKCFLFYFKADFVLKLFRFYLEFLVM